MSSVLFFENPTHLCHDASGGTACPGLDLDNNLENCREHLHKFAMGMVANQERREKG
jgi:hypothetical protein